MSRKILTLVVPLVFALTAGGQPAVRVLPQAPLHAALRTALEVSGATGIRTVEIDLRDQRLEVPVEGEPPWTLRCSDPGLWCQDLLLLEEMVDPTPFPVFREATLVGRVPARVVGAPLERIVLHGWVEYSAEESPLFLVLDLPIEDGVFRARIPHAALDLRIALPGAEPTYRRDLRPDGEGRIDLGEVSPPISADDSMPDRASTPTP